MTALFDAAIV